MSVIQGGASNGLGNPSPTHLVMGMAAQVVSRFAKRRGSTSGKLIDGILWLINIAVVCGKQRIVCLRSKISAACRVEYGMGRQTSPPAYFHFDLRGR